MSNFDLILIDMDGVIADYYRVILQQTLATITYDEWPDGCKEFEKHFGMDYGDVMRKVGSNFWATIPKTPWCDALMSAMDSHTVTFEAEKHILTSPPFVNRHRNIEPVHIADTVKGKLDWLITHFPHLFHGGMISFSWKKYIAASPTTLLIDDSESNIEDFRLAGGRTLLMPGKHNYRYAEYDDLMADPEEWIWKELWKMPCQA